MNVQGLVMVTKFEILMLNVEGSNDAIVLTSLGIAQITIQPCCGSLFFTW